MEIKSVKVDNYMVLCSGTLFIREGENAIIEFDNKTNFIITPKIETYNKVECYRVEGNMVFLLMVRDGFNGNIEFGLCGSDAKQGIIYLYVKREKGNLIIVHYNIMAK